MSKKKTKWEQLKCYKYLLLSHHPDCEKFGENHTINFGKYKFCIGCFIGYPTTIIGILIINYLNLLDVFDSFFFLALAMIFISSIILSPLGLTKMKLIKIIQKFLIGIGSAFLFWYLWSLPNSFIINFIYFSFIFGMLLMLLNMYHGYGLYKTCKECEYSMDWNTCPGFKQINDCLKEEI